MFKNYINKESTNAYKVNDKTFKPIPKPRTIQRPIPLPRRRLQGPPIPPPRPNRPRRGLKETFNYGYDSLSITELLLNNIIVNFLQRGSQLTYASQRKKLRKLLREKKITPRMVAEYAAQNPLPQQQIQLDTRYGSQRRRANLTKKNTKGQVLFGPEPKPRRQPGSIIINGEKLSAREALEKYSQLQGFLQPEKGLKENSLHAKLRAWFKNGEIPNYIINEQPPEFRQIQTALNQTFRDYILDDPRIKNYDVPTLINYLKPQIIRLMQQNPNTKVHLNLKARMGKIRENYKEEIHTFYSGEFEILKGTNLEDILNQMKNTIIE